MEDKCPVCDEEVKSQSQLGYHMMLHDPSDRVVCRRCGNESTTLALHRMHARKCFLCPLCGRKFTSAAQQNSHVCIINNGKPLICPCGVAFEKYDEIVLHAQGPKALHCCGCEHKASTLASYMRHIRKHSKQLPFECPFCERTFSSKELLKTHLHSSHALDGGEGVARYVWVDKTGVVREQCDDCGRSIALQFMDTHRAKHRMSSCLCPECGKIFDTPFKLSQHLSLHHSEPVTCDVCKKVLKTKKILAEHLKTHMTSEGGTRIAQAVCPRCGLELAQKGSLQRHIILVHERHRLKRNDSPRMCKQCGVTLPTTSQYYTHMRQHRAQMERYPCNICAREFNKRHNLLRHMYLLHDERRLVDKPKFRCEVCLKPFREEKNLKRHYRLTHGDKVDFSNIS